MDGGDCLVTDELLRMSMERAELAREKAMNVRQVHLQRLERLAYLEEKQNQDLVELKNCIEYINQHMNIIKSALRDADDGNAAVPVCSSIVRDIIAVKKNIEDTIVNSKKIKETLSVNYEPLMDGLLKKMDLQLSDWTSILNVASRNLLNSKALLDNIQNLISTQEQICSEVLESELFGNFDNALNSTSILNVDSSNDLLNDPHFCSTPFVDEK